MAMQAFWSVDHERARSILLRPMARRGAGVSTAHGIVNTPAFMPVGTAGTVKAMLPESVKATGAEIVLGNTYHLMLRPGAERVASFGGLHKFMNWPGPILTDSGGFQAMSLSDLRKINEQGVEFRSHIDGSKHMLTPERSIEIQDLLDSNITMVLDECTSFPATTERGGEFHALLDALGGTLSHGVPRPRRSICCSASCRAASIRICARNRRRHSPDIGFDGYAIGGLAIGEGQQQMFSVLDYTPDFLPPGSPALSDGCRQAQRSRRTRVVPWHRHVRLCDADALRPHRPCAYPLRRSQYAQCAPCDR